MQTYFRGHVELRNLSPQRYEEHKEKQVKSLCFIEVVDDTYVIRRKIYNKFLISFLSYLKSN